MSDVTTQLSSNVDMLMREFYIITNNLANVSTVGFKRRCNAFSKVLDNQETGTGEYSPGGVDLKSLLDFSQGSVVETGRPLDFALYGKGFFEIETTEGPLYTRNGMFRTNQNGQIVDPQGRIVAGDAGPITIPAAVGLSELNVSSDGTVSAGAITIGKFKLVDFGENENKLVSVGESCFLMPDENIKPVSTENIVVKQGYQEASNVKMVDELVDMIMVTRIYEATMKFVTAQKDTSSSILGVAMG